MILQEATVGGVVYLDYLESEMALPESDRVTFVYRALTNREKVNLLHNTANKNGRPNGADVCLAAVTEIKNLKGKGDLPLDTMPKLLAYSDKDNELAYMIVIAGSAIWSRQSGEELDSKN